MVRILATLRSLLRRTPAADEQAAPRFVVSTPAHLVVGIADARAMHSAGTGRKLIGGTHNISASGLAVLVPSLDTGSRAIMEGTELKILLDLHPLGTVEMDGLVARVEAMEEGERSGYLLGLKITEMSNDDRALYLEYIGTRGWERVLSGNDKI